MDRMNGTRTVPPADLLPFEPGGTPAPPTAPVAPAQMLAQVATVFDVAMDDLTGPSRRSYVSASRQAAAYILHTRFTTLSLRDIGTLLGGRDSSTIGQAIRRARERMAQDAGYAAQIQALLGTRT